MKIKQETIWSEADGLRLEMIVVIPDQIRGIVQISHGMSEHKERYLKFMEYLMEQGYIVAIHDHRGHGKSIRDEQELGYFYSERGEAIVEDLHQITLYLKKEYPDVPFYLFSHSMGTLVARNYIKKYDNDIDKLIMCGPPTKNSSVDLAIFLAKLSKCFQGDHYRNHFLHALAFWGYDKEFKNSWLTTDKDEVDMYNDDPLCGFVFTNNGFLNLFYMMKGAFSKKGWKKNNPALPIFVIAGEEDPVIQSRKKFEQLIQFLNQLGYKNIKSKLYKGMRHELLNEEKRQEVFEDVRGFLDS